GQPGRRSRIIPLAEPSAEYPVAVLFPSRFYGYIPAPRDPPGYDNDTTDFSTTPLAYSPLMTDILCSAICLLTIFQKSFSLYCCLIISRYRFTRIRHPADAYTVTHQRQQSLLASKVFEIIAYFAPSVFSWFTTL
ncbi:MAG TPA: hypothetical protein VIY48_04180, partial [Candidatus Paceibacterota bacterium]